MVGQFIVFTSRPLLDPYPCSSLSTQVQILEGALSLHGRLAPNEVQPLHRRMVELFATMKAGIKDSVSAIKVL